MTPPKRPAIEWQTDPHVQFLIQHLRLTDVAAFVVERDAVRHMDDPGAASIATATTKPCPDTVPCEPPSGCDGSATCRDPVQCLGAAIVDWIRG